MATTWPDTVVEVPDGARTAFTLTSGLSPTNELLFLGRVSQYPTIDYTISGSVITFVTAPLAGELIRCFFLLTGGSAAGSGVVTLGSMRSTIRQRADLVNSQFITDPELNGWINSSALELYDLLIQKYGNDYAVASPYAFTTDGTTDRFPLPSDLYKLIAVEVFQGGEWREVSRFNFAERNRGGVSPRSSLRYRLMGAKLWLRSGAVAPSTGQSMRLWYAPRLSPLNADGDAIDAVSGWEEYVIADCVIKCRLKGEEDPSVELALKTALTKRIEDAAENRDEGGPATVSDVRGVDVWPRWSDGDML